MARVLIILTALLALAAPGAQAAPFRPNVVVVMTDDQTLHDMAAMPRTRQLIGGAGATFANAYVSYPLCCPSRATLLSGQYAHNHNVRSTSPPQGGFEALDSARTLPVWLNAAGYDTIHIGKYLNGYGLRREPTIPPGWTEWYGSVDKSTYQMWGYTLFENGVPVTYGDFDVEEPALYQTDVLRDKAVAAITARSVDADPFFLSLNFLAPHGEVLTPGSSTLPFVRPAPRHEGRFAGKGLPRALAGEADVSDKPRYIRRLARAGSTVQRRILEDFLARRESLLAVDEAVEAVVNALQQIGELDNTYVLFTSDNGFLQGEHRIPKGKYFAYDASSHVPLLIRGPGIAPGTVSRQLTANTDLAPTILEATGANADLAMDGVSLLPYARDGRLRVARAILHEGLVGGDTDRDGTSAATNGPGQYAAIRTDDFLYVQWRGGERELYDLALDPRELNSLHRSPSYARIRSQLKGRLRRLRACAGADCHGLSAPAPRAR